MKTCPYCAEEIQDQAVKCKHCGSRLDGEGQAGAVEVVEKVGWFGRKGTAWHDLQSGCVFLFIIVAVVLGIVVLFFYFIHR